MAEFKSIKQAINAIARDSRKLQARIRVAVKKTVRSTRSELEANIPVAFGELKNSILIEDYNTVSKLIVAAPHSAAVEFGSRPHTPPLAPLIAWVKLRGMQGLSKTGRVRKVPTRASINGQKLRRAEQASRVAAQIKALQVKGKRGKNGWGKHSEVNAPEAVARGIQRAISLKGTKPQHYMAKTVPYAQSWLKTFVDREIDKASRERADMGAITSE